MGLERVEPPVPGFPERRQPVVDLHQRFGDEAVHASLRVLAHEDRIERVVGHLVQNALEATAAAGPAGRVALRVHREGGHAVLEVADNGVGMSEEFVRERLFRPFQTTKAHGMGVGLNESFQYVSAIGGVLAVDSAPGRGSTFRMRLPLADVAGHALEQAA